MAELTPVEILRTNITDNGTEQLFTDDQLNAWLTQYNGSINRATYRALMTIALSEVLLGKKIRTQDLSTDGPAVAAEIRAQAALYKADADEEDSVEASFFDVTPLDPYCHAEGEEYRW